MSSLHLSMDLVVDKLRGVLVTYRPGADFVTPGCPPQIPFVPLFPQLAATSIRFVVALRVFGMQWYLEFETAGQNRTNPLACELLDGVFDRVFDI